MGLRGGRKASGIACLSGALPKFPTSRAERLHLVPELREFGPCGEPVEFPYSFAQWAD